MRVQVVDAPPGTSDEHISITQCLKDCGVSGAVIVTTPQEVSLADVRKELSFCKKARAKWRSAGREPNDQEGADSVRMQVGLRVLGVVENMSGVPCCRKQCVRGTCTFNTLKQLVPRAQDCKFPSTSCGSSLRAAPTSARRSWRPCRRRVPRPFSSACSSHRGLSTHSLPVALRA